MKEHNYCEFSFFLFFGVLNFTIKQVGTKKYFFIHLYFKLHKLRVHWKKLNELLLYN